MRARPAWQLYLQHRKYLDGAGTAAVDQSTKSLRDGDLELNQCRRQSIFRPDHAKPLVNLGKLTFCLVGKFQKNQNNQRYQSALAPPGRFGGRPEPVSRYP
jgi:hypothetical protein